MIETPAAYATLRHLPLSGGGKPMSRIPDHYFLPLQGGGGAQRRWGSVRVTRHQHNKPQQQRHTGEGRYPGLPRGSADNITAPNKIFHSVTPMYPLGLDREVQAIKPKRLSPLMAWMPRSSRGMTRVMFFGTATIWNLHYNTTESPTL
jgi:hypothetical protein